MGISTKIHGFISQSSWIRKMFEEGDNLKKIYGPDRVFDFSLGNPNAEPPTRFKELLIQVAQDTVPNKHGYMFNAGYLETRESVALYLRQVHGVLLTHDHIIMTCGAGGALNVILKALLNPGDEVIVPAPFFVEYCFYIDNAGGAYKLVKTKSDFSLDPDIIDAAISEKTKLVLINSPNNPTGKVYDEESIKRLANVLTKRSKAMGRDIYLLSDEPYREIVYDGNRVPSVLAAYHNSIIASSYSKSLSLPGERIGYLAINPGVTDAESVIGAAVLCNRILGFVNAPALMQRIIANMQGSHVDVEEYRRKRDLLCDGLTPMGYRFHKPEGAFYLFVQSPVEDDVAFVNALLKENIIVVPGSGFGGPGYFRIAYCVEDKTIINAMERFRKVLEKYNQ